MAPGGGKVPSDESTGLLSQTEQGAVDTGAAATSPSAAPVYQYEGLDTAGGDNTRLRRGTVDMDARAPTSRSCILLAVLFVAISSAVVGIVVYATEPTSSGAKGPPPPDPSAFLYRQYFNGTHRAKCLDGSDSGFYWRPPRSNTSTTTWVIFLQGGGLCIPGGDIYTSCQTRSQTPLGSSTQWRDTASPPPILRSDLSSNPFRDAQHVWVPYCSGDLFAGNGTFEDLVFRGHDIVKQVVATLLSDYGLDNATDVLLTGESAGGLGTFFNADFVTDQIRASARDPDLVIKAAPLGGYYYARNVSTYESWARGDLDVDAGVAEASQLSVAFGGVPDQTCAAEQIPETMGRCFTAGWLQPYIETPLLIAENLYDPDKLERSLGMPTDGSNRTAQEEYQGYYARKLIESIVTGINDTDAGGVNASGYWVTSCRAHTENLGVGSEVEMNVTVGGDGSTTWQLAKYREVLADWFYNVGDVQIRKIDDCGVNFDTGPCGIGCNIPKDVEGTGPQLQSFTHTVDSWAQATITRT